MVNHDSGRNGGVSWLQWILHHHARCSLWFYTCSTTRNEIRFEKGFCEAWQPKLFDKPICNWWNNQKLYYSSPAYYLSRTPLDPQSYLLSFRNQENPQSRSVRARLRFELVLSQTNHGLQSWAELCMSWLKLCFKSPLTCLLRTVEAWK